MNGSKRLKLILPIVICTFAFSACSLLEQSSVDLDDIDTVWWQEGPDSALAKIERDMVLGRLDPCRYHIKKSFYAIVTSDPSHFTKYSSELDRVDCDISISGSLAWQYTLVQAFRGIIEQNNHELIALVDSYSVADNPSTQAFASLLMGNYYRWICLNTALAKEYYEGVLKVSADGPNFLTYLATIQLVQINLFDREYEQAKVTLEDLVESFRYKRFRTPTELSRLYTYLAMTYRFLGDFKRSHEFHVASIARSEGIGGKILQEALAEFCLTKGYYQNSKDTLVELTELTQLIDQSGTDHVNMNRLIGYCLLGEENYREAAARLELAGRFYEDQIPMDIQRYEAVMHTLSHCYENIGQFEKTVASIRDSYLAFRCLFDTIPENKDFVETLLPTLPYSFKSLAIIARAYQKLYEQNADVRYLKMAQSTYLLIDSILHDQIVTYDHDAFIALGAESEEVYNAATKASVDLFRKLGSSRVLDDVCHFLERKRDLFLCGEVLDLKRYEGVKSDIIKEEMEYRSLLEGQRLQQLGERNDKDSRIQQNSLTGHNEEIVLARSQYFRQLRDAIPSLEEIQVACNYLDSRIQMLDKIRDDICMITFDGEATDLRLLPYREVAESLDVIRDRFARNGTLDPQYLRAASEVYEILFSDLHSDSHKNLIIIPDSHFELIPFDYLVTNQLSDSAGRRAVKDAPFLIDNYNVVLARSLKGLVREIQLLAQKDWKAHNIFGYAFSDKESISQAGIQHSLPFLELPQSYQELVDLEDVFGRNRVVTWHGFSHHRQDLLEELQGRYDIIHLATHAYFDPEERLRLRFLMNQPGGSSESIYGHEIFALNIRSSLLVLSSCTTAGGVLVPGGVSSLANYFHFAGVPLVVATQVPIEDRVARDVIHHFYRSLPTRGLRSSLWEAKKTRLKLLRETESRMTSSDLGSFFIHVG